MDTHPGYLLESPEYLLEPSHALILGLPQKLSGKESTCNEGDLNSVPGLGRSPGEGHGNPLQYSCLGNPMDRGAWWVAVHGVAKVLDMTEQQHSLVLS